MRKSPAVTFWLLVWVLITIWIFAVTSTSAEELVKIDWNNRRVFSPQELVAQGYEKITNADRSTYWARPVQTVCIGGT